MKRDFTLKECEFMMGLAFVRNHNRLRFGEIAKLTEISHTNPAFYRVTKYLRDKEIITVEPIASAKFVKINHRLLKKLILEQNILNYRILPFLTKKAGFLQL